MKISDAISVFDFLGKLDWFGVIGLLMAVTLLVAYFVSSITDKIFDKVTTKRIIVLLSILATIICVCILKIEADRNIYYIARATNIKNYMLENNEECVGYKEISLNVDFIDEESCPVSDKACINKRTLEIENIIQRFPDDFSETSKDSGIKLGDSLGVALINESILNSFVTRNEYLYPLFREKILNYMRTIGYDTLNYRFIGNNIDTRCSYRILDNLVAKNPKLFIAIYSTYNRYDKNSKDCAYTDALEVNPDSIKKYLHRK